MIKPAENKITDLHIKLLNELQLKSSNKIDLIGFHGVTLFHDAKEKFTFQAGNAQRVFEKTKIPVVYNFRENDLINGGQGAPLTPIFHNVLANKINKKFNLGFPLNFLNIGGISNITFTVDWKKWELKQNDINAYDIGPGNCMIDQWIRKNSNKKTL